MGQCSHVVVHCPTWSTDTFGTVRIIYVNHTGGAVLLYKCVHTYKSERTCVWVSLQVCLWEWVILSCLNNDMHHALQNNHVLVYTHSVIFQSTTNSSSRAQVKSTLVHEVPHHWEATTPNCIVKACEAILILLKLPLPKEGQQVLNTLKVTTSGSKVKGSG